MGDVGQVGTTLPQTSGEGEHLAVLVTVTHPLVTSASSGDAGISSVTQQQVSTYCCKKSFCAGAKLRTRALAKSKCQVKVAAHQDATTFEPQSESRFNALGNADADTAAKMGANLHAAPSPTEVDSHLNQGKVLRSYKKRLAHIRVVASSGLQRE